MQLNRKLVNIKGFFYECLWQTKLKLHSAGGGARESKGPVSSSLLWIFGQLLAVLAQSACSEWRFDHPPHQLSTSKKIFSYPWIERQSWLVDHYHQRQDKSFWTMRNFWRSKTVLKVDLGEETKLMSVYTMLHAACQVFNSPQTSHSAGTGDSHSITANIQLVSTIKSCSGTEDFVISDFIYSTL